MRREQRPAHERLLVAVVRGVVGALRAPAERRRRRLSRRRRRPAAAVRRRDAIERRHVVLQSQVQDAQLRQCDQLLQAGCRDLGAAVQICFFFQMKRKNVFDSTR